jgi:flagellar protein FlbD
VEKYGIIYPVNLTMILVTRLNGSQFYINAEKVMTVEGTADTVITIIGGVKYIVKESPEQVVDKVIHYHREVNNRGIEVVEEK